MATSLALISAGASSAIIPVTPLQSVMVGPQVQGGLVTLLFASNPGGPFNVVNSIAASVAPASFRSTVNGYVQMTCATQGAFIAVSDIGAGQGSNPLNEPIVNVQAVIASANLTTETIIASFRTPTQFLKPQFRMNLRCTCSYTNNANAKTLQVRMNGLTGALIFQ